MIVMPYPLAFAVLGGILVALVVMWVMKRHQDSKPKPTWNKPW